MTTADATVWNTDVRNRPELEVEIQIVMQPHDVPGEFYARSSPALEVEMLRVEADEVPPAPERLFSVTDLAFWSFEEALDLTDELLEELDESDSWGSAPAGSAAEWQCGEIDDLVIYDAPPPGYRQALQAQA